MPESATGQSGPPSLSSAVTTPLAWGCPADLPNRETLDGQLLCQNAECVKPHLFPCIEDLINWYTLQNHIFTAAFGWLDSSSTTTSSQNLTHTVSSRLKAASCNWQSARVHTEQQVVSHYPRRQTKRPPSCQLSLPRQGSVNLMGNTSIMRHTFCQRFFLKRAGVYRLGHNVFIRNRSLVISKLELVWLDMASLDDKTMNRKDWDIFPVTQRGITAVFNRHLPGKSIWHESSSEITAHLG